MGAFRDFLAQVLDRLDRKLPSSLYAAVSVPASRARAQFRAAGRPFLDPEAEAPSLADVDDTARRVIDQAVARAAGIGGMAAMGGVASVPPEAVAQAVTVLRLAQRLAVVYGFDPDTDRGQAAVWGALAAGMEVELPEQGPLEVRLRDLPGLAASAESASGDLTRAVAARAAWMVAGRISRFVPLVAPGLSAVAIRKNMLGTGARMQALLRRMAEYPPAVTDVEEASEVR